MICAAIDIGTVTCRLFIAEVDKGIERELVRECRITNLGIGVSHTKMLADDAIERVVECVRDYRRICDEVACAHDLDRISISAVATSAARDAKNSDVLVDELAQLGINLAIIPGEREAYLSFLGASSEFPGEKLVVIDVGGGSTEVIFGSSSTGVEFAHSFDIGCRRITELFIHSDPPASDELAAAKAYLHKSFSALLARPLEEHPVQRAVALAGTATSVVSVDQAMEVYDSSCVHKTLVEDRTLDAVLKRLAGLTLEQRKLVVGLEPKRASVIVAGMLILQSVLTVLGQSSFTVSESDILQGIVMAQQD